MNLSEMINRGIEHHSAGRLREAEALYLTVLEADPNHADALHFMGVLAYHVGKNDIAKQYIQKAIEIFPGNHACYNNMGNIYQKEKNFNESINWYKKALDLKPDDQKSYNNLGVALLKLGKPEDSVTCLEKAIEIDSEYMEACRNLTEAYRETGDLEKALACCENALSLSDTDALVRWNRALIWLLQGDFKRGWIEYEWRWEKENTLKRAIDAGQRWNGEDLSGKTLFVYEEQGMGDTIHFIRYLPLIKTLGGIVIFEVIPPLIRLVEPSALFDRLYVGIKNQDTRPADRFDFHIPLLSLPGMFKTVLETIPDRVPYLKADSQLVTIWKKRINNEDKFKIGIVWAGHPDHLNDHNRSVLLSKFEAINSLDGISLFSLQKEKYERWTDIIPAELFEKDLGEEISDFADTAAIIENLDLVISVDTAVVHLAGALGKNVWTLVPFSPDWRWMTDREDSPWYPTMRLFRQPAPGDWDSVFKRVIKCLREQLEK